MADAQVRVERYTICLSFNPATPCEYNGYCVKPSIAIAFDSSDKDAHWHVCEEHAKEYEKMCFGGDCDADDVELTKRRIAYNIGYALIRDTTTIAELREYRNGVAEMFGFDDAHATAFELGITYAIEGKERLS